MNVAPVKIAIADEETLERRARALASGEEQRDLAAAGAVSVTFRLGDVRCAVEASAVERAILRLGDVFTIPLPSGGARAAAFVDERPLPIADLTRPPRNVDALQGAPALLVSVAAETVAVAVEGPLDLTEAAVAAAAEAAPARGDDPRILARLTDGAALLDPDWIRAFAARVLAP